jgi:hypothetical protein
VFGIQTGIAIVFLVKTQKKKNLWLLIQKFCKL